MLYGPGVYTGVKNSPIQIFLPLCVVRCLCYIIHQSLLTRSVRFSGLVWRACRFSHSVSVFERSLKRGSEPGAKRRHGWASTDCRWTPVGWHILNQIVGLDWGPATGRGGVSGGGPKLGHPFAFVSCPRERTIRGPRGTTRNSQRAYNAGTLFCWLVLQETCWSSLATAISRR